MNLAFVVRTFGRRGGTERDLLHLATALHSRRHVVTVHCARCVEAVPGIRIARIPLATPALPATLGLAWRARQLTRSHRYDGVIAYARALGADILRCGGGTQPGFTAALRAAGQNARQGLQQRLNAWLERHQYRADACRCVVAVSHLVRDDILRHYPTYPADRIHVIYDGVDTAHFHPSVRARRAEVRAAWNIPAGATLGVFVGHGFASKGLDDLLHAMAVAPDALDALLVVGNDAARLRFEQHAAERGLTGRVRFTGAQTDPLPFYAAADLLLLPSRREAFGNTVLEALACGLPAVVTKNVGAAEILEGELRQGIAADAAELPAAIRRTLALSRNPATAATARAIAEQYSFDRHVDAMETLITHMTTVD